MNKCICEELKEEKEIYLSEEGIEPEIKIVLDNSAFMLEASNYDSMFIPIEYCPLCGHKLGEE